MQKCIVALFFNGLAKTCLVKPDPEAHEMPHLL